MPIETQLPTVASFEACHVLPLFLTAQYDEYVVGAMAGCVCRVATPPKLDESIAAVHGVPRYLAWILV